MPQDSKEPTFRLDFGQDRFRLCHQKVVDDLLKERSSTGHWKGHLSSSALSTATAITALALLDRQTSEPTEPTTHWQHAGLKWLKDHVNEDGGWGDTTLSLSNISTTALVWAAFGAIQGADGKYPALMRKTRAWLKSRAGSLSREDLSKAIIQRYGKDKTFSIPILTMCALSGRFGEGKTAWQSVAQLPFELAALPPQWYAALKLPVVSYALPALIAIGQVRHHRKPTRNPITRFLRKWTRSMTLKRLHEIQPSTGGFLEATPLTSFVTMSLAGCGLNQHPVAQAGKAFLVASVRPDGSWPIDTNLATWVTSLSVHGLGELGLETLPARERTQIETWLMDQQFQTVHPYTQAKPGGWAWTDLPGGVPDADDTPGALIALHHLSQDPDSMATRAWMGMQWLMDLQNRDGGIPTFCRGWGTLPFDRSSADLTAHTLRAWTLWKPHFQDTKQRLLDKAVEKAIQYLDQQQSPDGFWMPLWFGNQHVENDQNPVYGTTKVMEGLLGLEPHLVEKSRLSIERALKWLLDQQNADGGWGGSKHAPSSVEETALSIAALAKSLRCLPGIHHPLSAHAHTALTLAGKWLFEKIETDTYKRVSPIGFYFAKLWYWESMYPLVYTAAALSEWRQYTKDLEHRTHSQQE